LTKKEEYERVAATNLALKRRYKKELLREWGI
jgi:hypothetical protein